MTTVTLTRDNTGKVDGFTDSDRKWLGKWKSAYAGLEHGELLSFDFKLTGSRKYHNLCMRMKRDIFDSQEYFADFEVFRQWLYVGAGHVTWVAGATGGVVAIPGTFSDDVAVGEATGDEAKRLVLEKIKVWMRSGKPAHRLWKHLDDAQRTEMVEAILLPYEGQAS